MEDGAGYARENMLATFFCSYMVPSNCRLSLGISRFRVCIDWHLVLFMYRQMYRIRLASGGDTSSFYQVAQIPLLSILVSGLDVSKSGS